MGRYLKKHLVLGLGYGLVMIGLKWWQGRWGESYFWQDSLWFGLGVIVGVWLLFLDRLVYVYMYPEEQLSQQVIYWWKQKKYWQSLALLDARRSEQNRLMLRSALFMGIWVLLALFSLTSSLSFFGRGVVMGMMWHSLCDAWRLQRLNKQRLNQRLFWQIKREVSEEEKVGFLVVVSLIFGLLSWWM